MNDNYSNMHNYSTEIEVDQLTKICDKFHIKGTVTGFSSLKNGNINKTFAVFTKDANGKQRSYILQQINSNVFLNPEIISKNIDSISKYMFNKLPNDADKDRLVVRIFDTDDGEKFYIDGNGNYWRLMSYIFDSICVNTATAQIMENSGIAFGRFLSLLSDFPIETLHETIPAFHNTPKRVADLKDAYDKDVCGRRKEVDYECRYIFSQQYFINFFEDAYREGRLPKRVTHNDTKCNNVMFDAKTLSPLAVIDLDTVMPGLPAYDFGDAIRSGANTCAEDDENFKAVELDLEKYEAFCRGYIGQVKDKLTRFELETLYIGAVTTILEIGARFLEDYLRGDIYFTCRKDKHNYYRGKNQVALLKSAIDKLEDMKKISYKYFA